MRIDIYCVAFKRCAYRRAGGFTIIMRKIYFFVVFIVLIAHAVEQEYRVEVKSGSIAWLPSETLELYITDADTKHCIGEVSAVCLSSCLSWYVLYGFYIKNEYRNKGHGTWLGHYVLNKLIHKNHARKIYIQPGPFDANDRGMMHNLSGPEREERLRLLMEKYRQAGFNNVSSSFVYAVQLLYCILGIEEDAHYLLVYRAPSSQS